MAMMEKLKVDRVWCDEIFYRTEVKEDIQFQAPAGTVLAEDTLTINGEATTAVLSCELRPNFQVDEDGNLVTDPDTGEPILISVFADVEIMVQEELTVVPNNDDDPFELEYAFRFRFEDLEFQKCQLEGADLERLKCQIFRLESDVSIEVVDVDEEEGTAVFNNVVDLMLKIKIDEEVQTFVALGTAPNLITRPIITGNNG